MRWFKNSARFFVVTIGIVVLTTLGIDAADTMSGSKNTLLGQLISIENSACPAGMVELPAATSFSCADQFEVSPNTECPYISPRTGKETIDNITARDCEAEPKEKAVPWRFVTRDQAAALCLKSGKRLPSNHEWHIIALGTPDDDSCNRDSKEVRNPDIQSACRSAVGIFDAVGNVWEWTSDESISGKINDRELPATGYVISADTSGIAIETGTTSSSGYGHDYIWTNKNSVWAVMRGGFYGSGEDAGIYSVHADVPGDMFGEAIGFRCVI